MREFLIAPLLYPELFTQWMESETGKNYAKLVATFSQNFSELLDRLDNFDLTVARAKNPDAKQPTLSRKEKWIECVLGEIAGPDVRIHGLIHEDVTTLNNFLKIPQNSDIVIFLEANIEALKLASDDCELFILTHFDLNHAVENANNEITFIKEKLAFKLKFKPFQFENFQQMRTFITTSPDAPAVKETAEQQAALPLIKRYPFSDALKQKALLRIEKNENSYSRVSIVRIKRLLKILKLQRFENALPFVNNIIEIFQFLEINLNTKFNDVLYPFYQYIVFNLAVLQKYELLQKICNMLKLSLEILTAENKLTTHLEITTYFQKNNAIRIHWQSIQMLFNVVDNTQQIDCVKDILKLLTSYLSAPTTSEDAQHGIPATDNPDEEAPSVATQPVEDGGYNTDKDKEDKPKESLNEDSFLLDELANVTKDLLPLIAGKYGTTSSSQLFIRSAFVLHNLTPIHRHDSAPVGALRVSTAADDFASKKITPHLLMHSPKDSDTKLKRSHHRDEGSDESDEAKPPALKHARIPIKVPS